MQDNIWDGSEKPITLLVNASGEASDTIHFYRYVPVAKKRVARLILRCDESFKTLFPLETCLLDEPLPEFDERINIEDLPAALDVEVDGSPYLVPNGEETFASSLDILTVLPFTKIGICWSSDCQEKSVPVELFQPWTENGMKFFSLDDEPAPENFYDLRQFRKNWNQTVNFLTYLDMVVTVDTGMAHLAGALGVQTAVMVNTKPDWRWESTRGKTKWYDCVQVIQQTQEGDWAELTSRLWSLIQAS
jgi:hypothetical protein